MKCNDILRISKVYKVGELYFVNFRVSFPSNDTFDIKYWGYTKSDVKAFLSDSKRVYYFIQSFILDKENNPMQLPLSYCSLAPN